MTWEYLLEYGSLEDLLFEAEISLEMGEPVPVDVMARLQEAGYYTK